MAECDKITARQSRVMRVMEDARRCMDHRVKIRLENIEEGENEREYYSIGEMDS